eukprot:TRINITY_DN42345_c0_g1_i1.p1 TRINITY_DN42345_c0_g1~~TRINITY_DN42345_c0_g1_i1.p1  ORF type:complete len:744 (+),score=136.78 TRINITY_DN42345_c0_g1_i1:43-2274(+)
MYSSELASVATEFEFAATNSFQLMLEELNFGPPRDDWTDDEEEQYLCDGQTTPSQSSRPGSGSRCEGLGVTDTVWDLRDTFHARDETWGGATSSSSRRSPMQGITRHESRHASETVAMAGGLSATLDLERLLQGLLLHQGVLEDRPVSSGRVTRPTSRPNSRQALGLASFGSGVQADLQMEFALPAAHGAGELIESPNSTSGTQTLRDMRRSGQLKELSEDAQTTLLAGPLFLYGQANEPDTLTSLELDPASSSSLPSSFQAPPGSAERLLRSLAGGDSSMRLEESSASIEDLPKLPSLTELLQQSVDRAFQLSNRDGDANHWERPQSNDASRPHIWTRGASSASSQRAQSKNTQYSQTFPSNWRSHIAWANLFADGRTQTGAASSASQTVQITADTPDLFHHTFNAPPDCNAASSADEYLQMPTLAADFSSQAAASECEEQHQPGISNMERAETQERAQTASSVASTGNLQSGQSGTEHLSVTDGVTLLAGATLDPGSVSQQRTVLSLQVDTDADDVEEELVEEQDDEMIPFEPVLVPGVLRGYGQARPPASLPATLLGGAEEDLYHSGSAADAARIAGSSQDVVRPPGSAGQDAAQDESGSIHSGSSVASESFQTSHRTVLADSMAFGDSFDAGLNGMLQSFAVPDESLSIDESLTRSVRRVLQLGAVLTGQQLSEDEVRALPKVRFHDAEQQCCPICLEAYQQGELLTALHCRHFFHIECLARWFRQSSHCPLCRSVCLG